MSSVACYTVISGARSAERGVDSVEDYGAGPMADPAGDHGVNPNPSLTCAEIRCTLLAGANPVQQLLLRLVATAADHKGNDMV